MAKERIAILGGGAAALTTAFELTRDADWQERYEITVYQMGWRLGGKGEKDLLAPLGIKSGSAKASVSPGTGSSKIISLS